MSKILIITILFLISATNAFTLNKCLSEKSFSKYFVKQQIDCFDFKNSTKKYFSLVLKEKNENIINSIQNCSKREDTSYYKKLDNDVKLKMIEELLSYENDIDFCSIRVTSYDYRISTIPNNHDSIYSIQLEALFIINQIYYVEEPYLHCPFPILVDLDTQETSTQNIKIVINAFQEYKKWFLQLKKIGIEKALEIKLQPLNYNIEWFGKIW